MTFLKNFSLVDTINFICYLFCLYFSHRVDLDLEKLHPANSSDGIFGEHSGDEGFEKWGEGTWKLKIFAVEDFDEVGDWVGLEGAHSENHFIDHNSQGPDICFVGVDLSFENFGSHVDGRAKHGFGHLVCGIEIFAETEIS